VSKAKCKNTGRIVALKILENQCKSEYDTIKLVREIQLMKRLNKISKTFVTELIDIITPDSQGIDSK
jgi:mitogen-activated protein kinase 1/3